MCIRDRSFYHIVSSVNEAFADLNGLYVNSPNASGIDRINCFEKRDPSLSRYSSNGEFKILSNEFINIFYSRTTTGKFDCNKPWIQDVHDFGQPIAHGVHRLFVEAVGNNSVLLADRLLVWASHIHDLVSKNAEVELNELVYQAVKASANNSRLSASQCGIVSDVFPTFYDQWGREGKLSCQ